MSKQSEAAGALAAVVIAALGGPIPLVRAALSEVVKYVQARYDENEETRRIRNQVVKAVEAWVETERLGRDNIGLGVALGAETIARFGVTSERLAKLNFEAIDAAKEVIAAAKRDDHKYWGSENHYTVAERAIGVTYTALVAQLRISDDTVISSFLALRSDIDTHAAHVEKRLASVEVSLEVLFESLAGIGTVSQMMAYLRVRIADWDTSVWNHYQKASAVEQPLSVRELNESVSKLSLPTSATITENERILVVLGGPGAGKTWLARNHARQAAEKALSMLEDGAHMDEVELPLLTTWDQWSKTSGPPANSLVGSSFASGLGHSDTGDPDAWQQLERTFLHPDTRVLMIIDSLDEAADQATQGQRLRLLHGLPLQWRVIITSRPAAWAATTRGSIGNKTTRIVKLKDLVYPRDVETFIRSWFNENPIPGRADALIREIRNRPELARVSTVPLMLTFYCLIAEDPKPSAAPLPARRRELYRRLVRRVLRGAWTVNSPGPDAGPDISDCEELLRVWSWEAVRAQNNAAGLGAWTDSFTQPGSIREPLRRAIDHIAPKTAVDDEGGTTRRFIHRTFLEHFVAEHLATLDTDTAADSLLPHLWFDPDWQITAPAAIIAHNQQHQGELLQYLLDLVWRPITDQARQAARREIIKLLLAIAQESEPEEWTQKHQDLIHSCRVDSANDMSGSLERSSHWIRSNPKIRTALVHALTTPTDPRTVSDLARVLTGLAPTPEELTQARTALIQ